VGVEPANDCGTHLLSELRIITVAAIEAFKQLVADLSLDRRLLQEAGFRPSIPSVVRAFRSGRLNLCAFIKGVKLDIGRSEKRTDHAFGLSFNW